jgi:hypothetical protein
MKSAVDPLLRKSNSERLHYATGELLGADDFRDEQTYQCVAKPLGELLGTFSDEVAEEVGLET